jgi:hypothetical protein
MSADLVVCLLATAAPKHQSKISGRHSNGGDDTLQPTKENKKQKVNLHNYVDLFSVSDC